MLEILCANKEDKYDDGVIITRSITNHQEMIKYAMLKVTKCQNLNKSYLK